MVALPKSVQVTRKANGRAYYYYAKFRSTPDAWPKIPLPRDPLSAEFLFRVDLCERLLSIEQEGARIWKFLDAGGRKVEVPSPEDAAFWVALEKAEKVGKLLLAGDRRTFSALISEFKESKAYTDDLSAASQEQYSRCLKIVETAWGDDTVASLTTINVQRILDGYQETPAAGRVLRSVLMRLINWGIPRGYSEVNVVDKTETMASDGTYEPWTPEAFEIFFKHARPDLHLPVYSALFTGQRKVDVLKMVRPGRGVTEIPIVAQKTGLLVPVQMHSEYRRIIRATTPKSDDAVVELTPKDQPLHLRTDGEPWSYEGFKTAWDREMAREPFKAFRTNRWVFHSLRKNAVNMLLEAGCTEPQVGSIVGMSEAMVRHYSLRVNRFRLARAAMKTLEAAWGKQRVHVLGKVRRAR